MRLLNTKRKSEVEDGVEQSHTSRNDNLLMFENDHRIPVFVRYWVSILVL